MHRVLPVWDREAGRSREGSPRSPRREPLGLHQPNDFCSHGAKPEFAAMPLGR